MYGIPQCTSIPMTILDVIFVISVLYAAEVFFFLFVKLMHYFSAITLTKNLIVPTHVHS